ncbi:MAG: hypothetical protein ACAH08_09720 [Methylophilus sp.]
MTVYLLQIQEVDLCESEILYGQLPVKIMYKICLFSNLTSTELASWIQAIGSILAIITSAFIVWWQVNRQNRLAQLDRDQETLVKEYRCVETITHALATTNTKILQALYAFGSAEKTRYYAKQWHPVAEFDLSRRMLKVADLKDLSDADIRLASVVAIYDFDQCVELIFRGIKLLSEEENSERLELRLMLQNRLSIFNYRSQKIQNARLKLAEKLSLLNDEQIANIRTEEQSTGRKLIDLDELDRQSLF